MDSYTGIVDRSRDLSQPLDKLGADERLKADSDYLRGTIAEDCSTASPARCRATMSS